MPELPEVETVRRGLEPVMVGATVVAVELRRADLRFPFPENFAARLKGRRIVSLERRAKYLRAWLDDGMVLVMHLGMSGSFRIGRHDVHGHASHGASPGAFYHERSALKAHDHVVFALSGDVSVFYNDPRRFGFMLLVEGATLPAHPLFRHLGIEPLGSTRGDSDHRESTLDGTTLAKLFAGRSTSLKTVLLDQTVIAGLGNIYVCEALHRTGLSPRRSAGTLTHRDGSPSARATRLAEMIREVLLEAISAGGSSLRDHRQADGSMGYFQHSFRVYDQKGCPCPKITCSGTVARIVQGGRSTFYCPVCQR